MLTKQRYVLPVGALFGLMSVLFIIAALFSESDSLLTNLTSWTAPLYVIAVIGLAVYLSMKSRFVLIALFLMVLAIILGFVGPSWYTDSLLQGYGPDGSSLFLNPIIIATTLLFGGMAVGIVRIYKTLPSGFGKAPIKPGLTILLFIGMIYALFRVAVVSMVLIALVRA